MILKKYDTLPENLKNEKVKEYYDILYKKRINLQIKRLFDIIASIVILVVFLPLIILIALVIKIDSEGPVFYKQERVTTNGKLFKIFKFRTMVVNADKQGSLITTKQDARITRVGKVIRKIRLDEVPQLINVLKGEMSFVGTRPEVKKYVDQYTDEMKATLLMPAGVTSLASIHYKDEDAVLENALKYNKDIDTAYVEYILPQKMKYNLEYIKKFTVFYDIMTCIKTVIHVFR